MNEVHHETEIWQRMPRRMLRHRVLQQCARIAIGINTPEIPINKDKVQASKNLYGFRKTCIEGQKAMAMKDAEQGIAGLRIKLANSRT
jgi:hypothetical protein